MIELYSREKRADMKRSKEFKNTNKPWGDLHLNSYKNVGAVMALAKESNAKTFEEWESYYFQSGEKRNAELSAAPENYPQQSEELNQLNYNHGRTVAELEQIAQTLANRCNISIQNAFNYVYIRVLDETWKGYETELNAEKEIQLICDKLPGLTISHTDLIKDNQYAVDFELYNNSSLLLGIQIKPTTYRDSFNPGVIRDKKTNEKKNQEYKNEFGADVLYLYTDWGKIVNMNELLETLKVLLGYNK